MGTRTRAPTPLTEPRSAGLSGAGAIRAVERALLQTEGAFHVHGCYFASAADADVQRRWAAERLVRQAERREGCPNQTEGDRMTTRFEVTAAGRAIAREGGLDDERCVWCGRELRPDDELTVISGRATRTVECEEYYAPSTFGPRPGADRAADTVAAAIGEAQAWDDAIAALALGLTREQYASFARGEALMPRALRRALARMLRLRAEDLIVAAHDLDRA